jgi:hypothetical protein
MRGCGTTGFRILSGGGRGAKEIDRYDIETSDIRVCFLEKHIKK